MIRFLTGKNGGKIPDIRPVFKKVGVFVALQLCHRVRLLFVYKGFVFGISLLHKSTVCEISSI